MHVRKCRLLVMQQLKQKHRVISQYNNSESTFSNAPERDEQPILFFMLTFNAAMHDQIQNKKHRGRVWRCGMRIAICRKLVLNMIWWKHGFTTACPFYKFGQSYGLRDIYLHWNNICVLYNNTSWVTDKCCLQHNVVCNFFHVFYEISVDAGFFES